MVPGQELNLTINLTNVGNSDDVLSLSPSFGLNKVGNDSSNWSAEQVISSRLNIFENEVVHLEIEIPDNTWSGTTANLTLETSSEGFDIDYDVSIQIKTQPVSGWKIDLSNTSLEVPPNGGILELTVEQMGNNPAKPYFIKAGDGWNVSLPNSGDVIDPGNFGKFNISVYPPENSVRRSWNCKYTNFEW